MPAVGMDHSVNLFSRYEQVMFAQQTSTRPVSCVIITGFLGSGKTTLVNHLLRHNSDLRLAVLVNEVGAIDIDGQLVSLQQTNAAVGAVGRQLAGGCACCEVKGDLRAAAKELLAANQDLDYLVLETSGAADVEPMVEVMREAGLQLDGVVAVVDAEAALQQLESGVAVHQVQAADLVVLNKCDLASLGQMATVEDRIRALAPSTAVVRARHAQVDPALLFAPPSTEQGTLPTPSSSQPDAGTPPPSVAGQVAFMSHESAPVLRPAGTALVPAPLRSRRPQPPPTASGATNPVHATSYSNGSTPSICQHQDGAPADGCPAPAPFAKAPQATDQDQSTALGHEHPEQRHQQRQQKDHQHHHHHHHAAPHQDRQHLHADHHVATRSFAAGRPISLAWFQRFVVEELLPTPGLLRAKGLLWFSEEPGSRFAFHLSGRRRVECHTSEGWSCPPSCQLVLIGQGAADLERLCGLLQAAAHAGGSGPCLPMTSCSSTAACDATTAAAAAAAAAAPGAAAESSTAADSSAAAGARDAVGGASTAGQRGAAAGSLAASQEGVAVLRQLIAQHPRFAVVERGHGPVDDQASSTPAAAQAGGCPGGSCCSMVEFTAVGSPLHGVFPEAVNADLLVKFNGCGRLLLSSRKVAGAISSVSLRQSPFKCVGLLLAVEGAAAAASAWHLVEELALPVMRKAFAHVHNCGCDVHVGPT